MLMIVGGIFYGIVDRLLAHKERMAEIEAKRPKIVLQLPESSIGSVHDELTEEIIAACRAKGIDVDLALEAAGPDELS